jgi:hypothetical protein
LLAFVKPTSQIYQGVTAMTRYRQATFHFSALLLPIFVSISAVAADRPVTVGQDAAGSGSNLKDLVTEKKSSGNDPLGLPFEGGNATSKYIVNPEYSKETGATMSGAYGRLFGDNAAIGGILTLGGRKKEGILNLGYKTGNQQLILTLDQLRQSLNFDFLSGPERVEMTQNSAAASYKFKLGKDSRRFVELNAYHLKTNGRSLDDVIMITDTVDLYESASVQRRIASGKVSGFQGQFSFAPFSSSVFKSSLGQERLQYGLAAGNSTVRRLTGGLEWNQQLFSGYSMTGAANHFAAQKRYSIGVERCLAGGQQIGLDFIRIQGRDGTPDDSQVRLTWAAKLGGPPGCARRAPSEDPGDDAPTWRGRDLLDQVVLRPDFLPSQVVAKVDDTVVPRRIVGVNKGGLPQGSSVGRDGTITVPLSECVSTVTSVTRNDVTFSNTGQFSVPSSCTTLVINPGGLLRPAAGAVDTYVVSTGTAGSCSVAATVNVSANAVTVAGVSTAGCDTTPNPFRFTAQANVQLNTLVESNAITISGINAASPISVTGGEYQINGGPWTTLASFTSNGSVAAKGGPGAKGARAGTITNGQTVKVRHVSAATNNASVNTTLTIGGVSATFTSTTAAANAAPTITNLPANVTGVKGGSSVPMTVTFDDDRPFTGPASVSVTASLGSISGFVGGAYGTKNFVYTAPFNTSRLALDEILMFSVTDSDGVTTTATVTFQIN